jgi:hypothetical protein
VRVYHRPVLLVGRNGTRFELAITGYEFPAIMDDPDDSNWLMIRVDVDSEQGAWTRTDPSLMAGEVEPLARWLEVVATGEAREREFDFLEPNLAFELRAESGEEVTLRVWFELELRPPWARSQVADERDVWVDLEVTREALRRAATQLREGLRAFPPRATATES